MSEGETMKNQIQVFLIFLAFNLQLYAIPPQEIFVQPENEYLTYCWGCYNQLENNNDTARYCFESLINNNQNPQYAYDRYIQSLFQAKEYQKIIDMKECILTQLKDHIDVQLCFIKSLESIGETAHAEEEILKLYDRFPNNPEVVYGTAIAYIRQQKAVNALTIIQKYLKQAQERSHDFIFHFLSAQLYLGLGETKKAQESIQKSLTLNPTFEQGWLLSGLINELTNNISEAIQGYQQFLSLSGSNPLVEQQLLQILHKQQQSGGIDEFKKMLNQAFQFFQKKQFVQALEVIEKVLAYNNQYEPAQLLKVDLLCSLHKTSEAIEYIASLLNNNAYQETWFKVLYLLYQTKIEQKKIITLLRDIESKFPNCRPALLYLTDIYLKLQDYHAATIYLKKIIAFEQNIQIQEKALYQLARLYFEHGNYSATHQIIEIALQKDINFAPLLNLAAYFYATKGKNLDKAEQLIKSVLVQNADNPHYLDTQAVIWYKKNMLQKSITLLQDLQKRQPHDFFICKHLGKVLYKSGKKEEAIRILKQAISKNSPPFEQAKANKLVVKWSKQKK